MIQIQIISADNLPVPTTKERKTKIFCFSASSCNYFYDSFKNKENTRNPKWNSTFNVDLFRCSNLTFKLYSSRLLSRDIYLGEVLIDFSSYLLQSPGNEILKQPYGCIRCEFPITSCNSPNAILSLSFLYIPRFYRPIQFKDVSSPFIHVWSTFTPSIESIENNIEIELFQAYVIKEKKNKTGFFYNLNNFHSWESVGYSSSTHTVLGPTGFTPIRTFFLERINNKYNFFIINVSNNYSGIVTLNILAERQGKAFSMDDKKFIMPRNDKNHLIGTVKTVDIKVEPNKKYLVPIYLFYEKKMLKKTFDINQFQQLTTHNSNSKSDFADQISSEIPFYSGIIEIAQTEINDLKNSNLMKTIVLPQIEKVNIQKVFQDFNLQCHSKIRIYINGSTTVSSGNQRHTNYWTPFFTIFDINTGKKCHEISKRLTKKPLFHFRNFFEKSALPIEWHTYVDLDLDEIGIDKIIVFNIACLSSLESASPPGVVYISHIEGESETLLFRTPIFEETCKTYVTSFMRFEFIEDSWNIIQMRYAFRKKKKFDFYINALFKNNWVIPEFLMNKIEGDSMPDSSDEEILLDEIESAKDE